MLLISSPQNPHIKRIKALQEKARKRKEEGAFIIEGEKEIRHALANNFQLEQLYFKEKAEISEDLIQSAPKDNIRLSSLLFKRLCYRTTSKALAIALCKSHSIENIQLPQRNPLVLVAESPEKPGNIGALLRTADAMRVDAVLIAEPKTELYNPNVIRASVGCLFTVPVAVASRNEIFSYLEERNIPVYSAALVENAKVYTQIDFTRPTAIAVGTEHKGLSAEWLKKKSTPVIIPMRGKNDSLNVSVAAGILLAEVQRQRN